MDFLDPKKKKAHKRQLYIGYVLVGIAIFFAGVILLYAAFGYGFDRTGNVIQNGLVYIASTPENAEVNYKSTVSGEVRRVVTPDRLPIQAGEYEFEFLKEGYRPWQHKVDVHGGDVERLIYPFLFPEELKTSDISSYSKKPSFSSATPDRSKIVIAQPNKLGVFDVIETNDPTKAATTVTLPSDVFALSTGTLSPVEWSNDNRHLLLRHDYNKTTDFIIADIDQPETSINIDTLFKREPKQVTLFDKKPDQFYMLLGNNQLLRADAGSKQAERVLNDVLAYKSHGDNRLVYVTSKKSKKNYASVFIRGDESSYKIRELRKSSSYLLDLAQHEDNWYVLTASSAANEAYIYRNPFETLSSGDDARILVSRTLAIEQPQYASFSENTQFITLQNDKKFATYDAYEDTEHYFEIESGFDDKASRATWMDGHRLMSSRKGKVIVFDFDGKNYQVLSTITPGTRPMFDRDYNRMLTIAPSQVNSDKVALTDTLLRVE